MGPTLSVAKRVKLATREPSRGVAVQWPHRGLPPEGNAEVALQRLDQVTRTSTLLVAATLILWLVVISPMWIERDAYRAAGGLLVLWALWSYYRADQRPGLHIAGWACLAWGAYVAARYVYVSLAWEELGSGSAEGLYLFPIAFMSLGYAWLRTSPRMRALPDVVMVISAVLLAVTIDFGAIFNDERTPFLIHKNTIHASVGAGLIAILAFCYCANVWARCEGRLNRENVGRLLLGGIVILLCLLGIYGAKSKGVWMSLALTAPVAAGFIIWSMPRRGLIAILAALAGLVIVAATLHGVIREAGRTIVSALDLIDASTREGLIPSFREAIASNHVPRSFEDRLKLWVNAWEVWTAQPWQGWGIGWKAPWRASSYAEIPYTLMHNGYLEIAIRYGWIGLGFFAALYATFATAVVRAWRARLIPTAAAHAWLFCTLFFALTMLSNSNNRLATGEAFSLVSAGFGFFCLYRLQGFRAGEPSTREAAHAAASRHHTPTGDQS